MTLRTFLIAGTIITLVLIAGGSLILVHNFGTMPPPPRNCAILGPAPPAPRSAISPNGLDAHGNIDPPIIKRIVCTPPPQTIPPWAVTDQVPR